MKNKNTLIISIAVLAIIVVVGGVIFLNREQETRAPEKELKELLSIEQDLTPIELSQEELQALQDEGIEPLSSGVDKKATALQGVRSSDELDAIEADLRETDLSGIDTELEAIANDLSGL